MADKGKGSKDDQKAASKAKAKADRMKEREAKKAESEAQLRQDFEADAAAKKGQLKQFYLGQMKETNKILEDYAKQMDKLRAKWIPDLTGSCVAYRAIC